MTLEGYTSNFPDADLIPENVRKDKTIFGVEGTLVPGVITNIGTLTHYKGITETSYSSNSGGGMPGYGGAGCELYGGKIYFYGSLYNNVVLGEKVKLYMIVFNIATGIITEYNTEFDYYAGGGPTRYVDGTKIYYNRPAIGTSYYFDMDGGDSWISGGLHTTGNPPTNLVIIGDKNYKSVAYDVYEGGYQYASGFTQS